MSLLAYRWVVEFYAMSEKLPYYYNLDGMRALAAIAVFLSHFTSQYNHTVYSGSSLMRFICEQLQHGVTLFFVLSGFVITRILFDTRTNSDYFRRFYWRRVLRIMPLYYLYLLFDHFILGAYVYGGYASLDTKWPTLLFLQNFDIFFSFPVSSPGHYWTLAVEEHFYLFWPLILFFVKPASFKTIFFVTLGVVFVSKIVLLSKGYFISQFTLTRMDQMLLGGLLAYLELNGFHKMIRNYNNIVILLLFSVVSILAMVLCLDFDGFVMTLLKHSVIGLIFFSILTLLIFENKLKYINKILCSRVLSFYGKVSYGFYVWHLGLIVLIKQFLIFDNFVLDFIITFGATTIVAYLSYYYFERYFLLLKDHKF